MGGCRLTFSATTVRGTLARMQPPDRELGVAVRMGTDRYGLLRINGVDDTGPPAFAVSRHSHWYTGSNNANSVPIRTYPYLSVFCSGFLSVARRRASNVER